MGAELNRADFGRELESTTAAAGDNQAGGHPASFSIGELAGEFGLTLRTLRFYEDRGLLSPRRRGLERIYGRRDRARLKLILLGKKIGFSLTEIKEMLDLYDLRDGQVTQLRTALDKFRRQAVLLEQQKSDIETALEELRRTMNVIAGMLEERESATA
jgi:DNA-binding transcriptional MerR regulator